jgi:hypothetical protein
MEKGGKMYKYIGYRGTKRCQSEGSSMMMLLQLRVADDDDVQLLLMLMMRKTFDDLYI